MEDPVDDSLIRAFGKELLDKLDPWICSELSTKWHTFMEGVRSESLESEKDRLRFQQSRFELEADLSALRGQLSSRLQESSAEALELSQIRVSSSEARRKLAELEETNTNLNIDNGSLRRERDAASGERSDLADLAERRQTEIDRLMLELKSLSGKLLSANNAKCEALVRAEEVESKEVSLKYREQRMEEERDFQQRKISGLTSELEAAHEDLLGLKREQVHTLAGIQAELASKSEEARHFEAKETAYKNDIEAHQKRAEELAKRLKQARDSETHVEENFRQELDAQTKLAQIYKDHAEEEKEKHKELESAIVELQSLLKTSSDKYGELETKLEKVQSDNAFELKKRNEAIKGLKSELENANGLIKNINTKGLDAEGIENLSPSAAAASRLIKSGMTLTQIYAQLVAVNEELICEKDETKRLNTYLDQILAEIEERAPILKQQRDDYERAVSAVSRLTERIEEAQEEVDLRKREASDATRRLGAVARENERLAQQVKDLSQQIVTLVKEVEALRSSNRGLSTPTETRMHVEGNSADSVITANLVSFSNIEELQAKNAELLSVVRELSEKVETVETHLVEEKTSELRKELMDAVKQVEELKEARVRQEAMVDNIISQRDLYKSVADQKEEQRKPQKWVSPEVEKKLLTTEATLKEISKEFEVYRSEKCENEKILLVQLEKTNKSLSEARTKAAKLSSQEEYNTERFKILQNNSKSYISQISILEERNKKLSEVINKHETSLSALRDSLFTTQSSLSRTELKLDRIKHENDALKAADARYQQEREVFYRERKSSAIVTENLKQIQLHLEREEDEAKMRLQNQNETLSKEISLLRKKLDSDSDAFKDSVRAWENSQKDLRAKLDEAVSRETLAVEEVKTLKNDIEEVRKELKDANEKLELSGRSSSDSTPIQQPPTSGKIRDLELLLNQSKNEVKSLKDQLANARQAVNQFKDLANSAEKRLTESSAATKVFREDYDRRLKEAEDIKKNVESQLEKIRADKVKESALKTGVDRSDNDLRQEINLLQGKLSELNEKYVEAIRIKDDAQKSLEEQSSIAAETQSKYERELMLHAQNVQLLQKYKEDLSSREDKSADLLHAKEMAEERLQEIIKDKEATENLLHSEYSSLKEQFDVLEGENKAVHDQLLDVTTQMTSIQQSSKGNESQNQSFSEEEASNSSQLMQIIKYLRKEKEILLSKSEVLQAELARIKSQKDYIQGQLEESTSALNLERENSSASVTSASKHYELVQKVETLSALMDSNRLLREEKDRLSEEIGVLKVKLNEAFESCNPLKQKISSLESKEETLSSENVALRGEATRWRQRATQLIEKSNKVNPEELKKIQVENNGLKKQLTQVQTQVRQNAIQVNNLNVKLKNTEEKASNDLKSKLAEISKLMQEKNTLNLKNNNLLKRVTELENTLKLAKNDIEKLRSSSLEPSVKQSLETSINAYKEELDKLKDEVNKREKEVKEQITSKNTSISKLRTIGRQFKEKLEAAEKELVKIKTDKANCEAEISQLKKQVSEAPPLQASSEASTSSSMTSVEVEDLKERLRQADELVAESASKINELEEQLNDVKKGNSSFKKIEELEKEIEEIREASSQKEQRARNVLKNARQKILKLDQTNSVLTKEVSDLKTGNSSSSSSEITQALKDSYESQIESLRTDKDKLQERINKMVESMSKKLVEPSPGTSTSSSSSSGPSVVPTSSPSTPPSAPTDVQTLSVKPMKSSVQPQAHIQPTRQKVSVQPMRMAPQQRGASGSGVRQVSVQPTILSVSPSTNSSASMNPTASEFVPARQQQQQQQAVHEQQPPQPEQSEDGSTPTAMVVPRGHASSSTSVVAEEPVAGPSSSGVSSSSSSSSTASVPPTPKRPREDDLNEDPSKKVKVTTPETMEEEGSGNVVVLEGEEEGNIEEDEIMVEDNEEEVVAGIQEEEEEEGIQEEENEDPQEVEEEEAEEEEDEEDGLVEEEDEEVVLEADHLDVVSDEEDDDDDVVEVVSDDEDEQQDEEHSSNENPPQISGNAELDYEDTPRLEALPVSNVDSNSQFTAFATSTSESPLRIQDVVSGVSARMAAAEAHHDSESMSSNSNAFAEQESVEETEGSVISSSTIPTVVQTTDRPRISRAPIVWNSPSPNNSPADTSSPQRLVRGARARRSRVRRGGYTRGSGTMKMPPGGGSSGGSA